MLSLQQLTLTQSCQKHHSRPDPSHNAPSQHPHTNWSSPHPAVGLAVLGLNLQGSLAVLNGLALVVELAVCGGPVAVVDGILRVLADGSEEGE